MLSFQEFMKYVGFVGLAVFIFNVSLSSFHWLKQRKDIAHKENFTNLFISLAAHLMRVRLTDAIVVGLMMPFYQHLSLFSFEQSSLFCIIACVFVTDFTYYWKHRFEHEVNLLWASHSVHHSSYDFNLTTAGRTPWLRFTYDWIFFAFPVVLGFHPLLVFLSFQFVLFYQTWIHTQHIGSMGWFDKIFNSPANHRVHHGSQAKYLDKNHAGILMVWDQLFGTYQKEEEAVNFGLTTPIGTADPFKIQFLAPIELAKKVIASPDMKTRLGYLFRKPGWEPANKIAM